MKRFARLALYAVFGLICAVYAWSMFDVSGFGHLLLVTACGTAVAAIVDAIL